MIYYAKLDENNKVIGGTVLNDAVITDSDGIKREQMGIDFLRNIYNEPESIWKQTFKDVSQRKNYAGIGYKYDVAKDAFISPKPFDSWTLNEDTCQWDAPTAKPDDDKRYTWNEETTTWDLIYNG